MGGSIIYSSAAQAQPGPGQPDQTKPAQAELAQPTKAS